MMIPRKMLAMLRSPTIERVCQKQSKIKSIYMCLLHTERKKETK
jgi:hypothetical protein